MTDGATDTLTVTIDLGACSGHGRCAATSDRFDLDDDGYAAAASLVLPAAAKPEVIRAIRSCPERAISLGE